MVATMVASVAGRVIVAMTTSMVTDRQLEALAAVVATGSYSAAAFTLGISPRTVRNHLVSLRARLGVETTNQAVYIAAARGLIVVPTVGRRPA
jgi:DNA-binding CsgD family transcriptional regulator